MDKLLAVFAQPDYFKYNEKESCMGRRKWSSEQKFAIVLQGIKGKVSVSDLCRDYGISQVQYYQWRDKFLSGAKQELADGRGRKNPAERDKAKIRQLEGIIGQQTVAIRILKKIWMPKRSDRLCN